MNIKNRMVAILAVIAAAIGLTLCVQPMVIADDNPSAPASSAPVAPQQQSGDNTDSSSGPAPAAATTSTPPVPSSPVTKTAEPPSTPDPTKASEPSSPSTTTDTDPSQEPDNSDDNSDDESAGQPADGTIKTDSLVADNVTTPNPEGGLTVTFTSGDSGYTRVGFQPVLVTGSGSTQVGTAIGDSKTVDGIKPNTDYSVVFSNRFTAKQRIRVLLIDRSDDTSETSGFITTNTVEIPSTGVVTPPSTEPTPNPDPGCVTLSDGNVGKYGTLVWTPASAVVTLKGKPSDYCNDFAFSQVVYTYDNQPGGFPQTVKQVSAGKVGKSGLTATAPVTVEGCEQVDGYTGSGPAVGSKLSGSGKDYEASHKFLSDVFGGTPSYSVNTTTCGSTTPPVTQPKPPVVSTNMGSCTVDTPVTTVTTSYESSIGWAPVGPNQPDFQFSEVKAGTYQVKLPKVAPGKSVKFNVMVSPTDDELPLVTKGPYLFSRPAPSVCHSGGKHHGGQVHIGTATHLSLPPVSHTPGYTTPTGKTLPHTGGEGGSQLPLPIGGGLLLAAAGVALYNRRKPATASTN